MTYSKLCGDPGKLCGCTSCLAEWSIICDQKHINPKRLNSPYLLRTMLGFFTQPTRGTRNFFAKCDITELNAPVFKEWLFQLCLQQASVTQSNVHAELFTMFKEHNQKRKNVDTCLHVARSRRAMTNVWSWVRTMTRTK